MRIRVSVSLVMLLLGISLTNAHSTSPTMNYQASLISGGLPVTTTVNVTFRIYDADVAGTLLWTELRSVTPDANGLMSIRLGEVTPIVDTVFRGDDRWLAVEVESDGELTPRTPLAGTPYAHRVATLDGATGGTLNGPLVLSESGAKFGQPPGDAAVILVNTTGDSLYLSPLLIGMKDNLGYEQFTVTNDPGQGAVLGIRLDGTESADHSAVTSSWSATGAKSAQAQSKKTQIGSQGMFLYGTSDMDTLVTLIEEASGVPELRLIDENATTATEPQTIQVGGQEAGEAIVVSVTDALGNKITETTVDANGSAELVFYDVSAAKANAPSPKKMSFTKDGLLLYGATDADTALLILSESGNIIGRGQVAMGQQSGLSVKSNIKAAPTAIWSTVFGFNNTASGDSATVSGGYNNNASGNISTIGGGAFNSASAAVSTIGGGALNDADGVNSTIGGGSNHHALGAHVVIAGGFADSAAGNSSSIGGGSGNYAGGDHSVIGGGGDNRTALRFSVVSGGTSNNAAGEYATISGGRENSASIDYSTVGGGRYNTAAGWDATVAGGQDNLASGAGAFVGGGVFDTASGDNATVCGGRENVATDDYATVSGGSGNDATAGSATVGGGTGNAASGIYATIGGGYFGVASGSYSVIPGGRLNEATGVYGFAAGHRAKATHFGSFVWGDGHNNDVASSANNQFTARSSGGVRFFSDTGLTAGVSLAAGAGAWASISDSTLKANIRPVDGQELLTKLAQLEVSRWNYQSQDPSIVHIGPMAQDFYRLFGVGDNNTTITTIDPDGIALAAIKELNARNEELEARVEELTRLVEQFTSER